MRPGRRGLLCASVVAGAKIEFWHWRGVAVGVASAGDCPGSAGPSQFGSSNSAARYGSSCKFQPWKDAVLESSGVRPLSIWVVRLAAIASVSCLAISRMGRFLGSAKSTPGGVTVRNGRYLEA